MINDCWNQIGVEGDRSCPELTTHTHCRNCPVYSEAGRGLLEREAPEGYLDEWTNLLAEAQTAQSVTKIDSALVRTDKTISVVIFRLGNEWLALPTKVVKEITQPCVIRTLPHRSNELLLGIVNISGEIRICISLSNFLGLKTTEQLQNKMNPVVYKRMMVVEKKEHIWVFPVEEIYGVHHPSTHSLSDAPAVIAKATETYTQGIINWQNNKISYLDEDLLFCALNRRILS